MRYFPKNIYSKWVKQVDRIKQKAWDRDGEWKYIKLDVFNADSLRAELNWIQIWFLDAAAIPIPNHHI